MKKTHWALVIAVMLSAALSAQPQAEAELASRYIEDGEYASALNLLAELYKKNPGEEYVSQMVLCYEQLEQYAEAVRFLERVVKREAGHPVYPLMLASMLEKTGDLKSAEKLFDETIRKTLTQQGDFIQAGTYLYQQTRLDLAREVYLEARRKLKQGYIFANELATIYAQQGDFIHATEENLNLYFTSPDNLSLANLAILNLAGPSSQADIERTLLAAIEKNPVDAGLRTILYEFYVLLGNFSEAFIQVKAIDRLFREDGDRIYQFAGTLRNNKRYDLANEALDYIIERKKTSPYFYVAHFEKAANSERKAFDQVPANLAAVQEAVRQYGLLLDEFGRKPAFFEAIYRRASLMVFYTNDLEGAKAELESLLQLVSGLKVADRARAQLLLGDIFLIQQQYNNAKLIYTEVSEAFPDQQTGATAKYKLAQLAYYKGDFNLAQALLSAIKDNTSNDISNDAIKLSLTILDNTGLDTTTTALAAFARAQLLVYQRSYAPALALLDSLADAFPSHSLADEILWEKANIFLKQNDYNTALSYLERILQQFPYDIYGDDALYTKARLYDYTLSNPEQAMKCYLDFLAAYPGSLFSVEIRKRIRELRQG